MNLQLRDPIFAEYPETLTDTFECHHATAIKFNYSGSIIAVGLVDGRILLWDLQTKKQIAELNGHIRTVQSLRWSRDGELLVSAARDWTVICWRIPKGPLLEGTNAKKASITRLEPSFELARVKLSGPVWVADIDDSIGENNSSLPSFEDSKCTIRFVAAVLDAEPVVGEIENGQVVCSSFTFAISTSEGLENEKSKSIRQIVSICFIPSTGYVLLGTTCGHLCLAHAETKTIIDMIAVGPSTATIREIRIHEGSSLILLNCSDRIIRVARLMKSDTKPSTFTISPNNIEKYQDQVSKLAWNSATFSANSEYVIASVYHASHDLYVWERQLGSLVRILEGPKEELTDLDWHPYLPTLAAIGLDSGNVHLWSVPFDESWARFNPDFEEVHENMLYIEREDEFDNQ